MSEFKNKSITSKGLELLSKALAGEQLSFTKIEMGSGNYEGDTGDAEQLIQPQQIIPITKISRKGGQVTLSSSLKIEDITSSFDWTEIGVYAKGNDGVEVLYMYGYTQNSSFISKDSLNEKLINITVMVSNATNITATIDNSLVYLTAEALKQHEQDINAHDGMREKMVDNLKYNNNCLQLEANGKPIGDKVFITAGESVRVNMFKTQSDIKSFTATTKTDTVPLPEFKENQVVKVVFDNLTLIEDIDFMVNPAAKTMTLKFGLEPNQTIYYTLENVSFKYSDLDGAPTKLPPTDHTHTAAEVSGINYPVTSVAGKTGSVTLSKTDVGLFNVPNYPATSSTGDTSNEKLATAGAVKAAMDKANQALDAANSKGVKRVQSGHLGDKVWTSDNVKYYDVGVSVVNTSKSFVIINNYLTSNECAGQLINSTTLRIYPKATVSNSSKYDVSNVVWQVVEFY